MVIINTKRFKLKTLTTKDVTEKYLSWLNGSDEIKKYISFAQKKTNLEDLIKYIQTKTDKKDTLFLGIFEYSGNHIGNVKYEPINLNEKSATMGILIGDKEWRGKGVASEVIKASSEYIGKKYDIKYIYLGVEKSNTPAVSAYKKMNFNILEENNKTLKMKLDLK